MGVLAKLGSRARHGGLRRYRRRICPSPHPQPPPPIVLSLQEDVGMVVLWECLPSSMPEKAGHKPGLPEAIQESAWLS